MERKCLDFLYAIYAKMGVQRYMKFDSEIVKCEWSEEKAKWSVHIRQKTADGETKEFVDECDVLQQGVMKRFLLFSSLLLI